MNDRKKTVHVGTVVLETVKDHLGLSLTILAVVAGAVGAALVPPLVLGRIVDGLTAGEGLTLRLPLWYLAFTALAGGLESARESARLAADSVVILISHRLYLFPELDRVIWLENGEAKVGTHEELVGNTPDYAAQFDAQREENSYE